MRATNFGAPAVFGVGGLALLVGSAIGDVHGGQGGPDWFLVGLGVFGLLFAWVFGLKLGVDVRVEDHTLTWRAPYSRRRTSDLAEHRVETVGYPWMGTASLRLADGSKVAVAVNTEDWNDFLAALDHRQGTELARVSRFTPPLVSVGEGFYRER